MQLVPNKTTLYEVTIRTKAGNEYYVGTYTDVNEANDCKRDLEASHARCGMAGMGYRIEVRETAYAINKQELNE